MAIIATNAKSKILSKHSSNEDCNEIRLGISNATL